jgi:hypothetical protein
MYLNASPIPVVARSTVDRDSKLSNLPVNIEYGPAPAPTPAPALNLVDPAPPFKGVATSDVQLRRLTLGILAAKIEEGSQDAPPFFQAPMGCYSCAGRIVIPERAALPLGGPAL